MHAPKVQRLYTLNFLENAIDGEAFIDLTEAEIKTMVIQLGWVKKIVRIQKELSLPSTDKVHNVSVVTKPAFSAFTLIN